MFRVGDTVRVIKNNNLACDMTDMVGVISCILNDRTYGIDFSMTFSFSNNLFGHITSKTGRFFFDGDIELVNKCLVELI